MRKILFAVVALAALAFVTLTPSQARASWLSEWLHYNSGYNPYAPAYGTSCGPALSPWYGSTYGAYTAPDSASGYAAGYPSTYWHAPGYYRPWYGIERSKDAGVTAGQRPLHRLAPGHDLVVGRQLHGRRIDDVHDRRRLLHDDWLWGRGADANLGKGSAAEG